MSKAIQRGLSCYQRANSVTSRCRDTWGKSWTGAEVNPHATIQGLQWKQPLHSREAERNILAPQRPESLSNSGRPAAEQRDAALIPKAAAVTKCHQLSGLDNGNVLSRPGGRKSEPEVPAGLVPSEGSQGTLSSRPLPSFRCFVSDLWRPRLVEASPRSLPSSSCVASPWAPLDPNVSFLGDHQLYWIRATLLW